MIKISLTKRKIKTLPQEEIQLLHNSCTNIRDDLLIRVLYEGGLRISEALSLEIDSFNINKNSITVKKSKTPAGENRTVYLSQDTMNLFQNYFIDFHGYEVDSNFVFIKWEVLCTRAIGIFTFNWNILEQPCSYIIFSS
ncbi:tyrosine-type recombinase/integrase [Peribacillus muralis]|uniref:tyrosine-type recombinase/integrase n=1 Tax=Peribacillus muralis TaxID=264697 RepID=UPI0009EBE1A9